MPSSRHRQQHVQLGVLGHQRLHEEGAALRVQARGDPIGHVVERILGEASRVAVLARQRVPIGHEVEAIVGVLQLDPVAEGTSQVAEMQLSRRAHAREHAFRHGPSTHVRKR